MTSPKVCLLAGFLFSVALFCGCTVIRSESPSVEPYEVSEEAGQKVHYSTLLHRMGPPTNMSQLGGGMVWLYEDMALTEAQFGLGFSDWPLSIFKINLGSGDGRYHGQLFVFDDEGYLVSAGRTDEEINLGSGVGFQFVFQVSSLVNLADINRPGVQHGWGQGMLVDLPEGLNRQQDLELGEHGCELLITPENVGQDTLAKP